MLQKISSAGSAGGLTSSDCKPIFCGSRLLCTRPVLKNRALRGGHEEVRCTRVGGSTAATDPAGSRSSGGGSSSSDIRQQRRRQHNPSCTCLCPQPALT